MPQTARRGLCAEFLSKVADRGVPALALLLLRQAVRGADIAVAFIGRSLPPVNPDVGVASLARTPGATSAATMSYVSAATLIDGYAAGSFHDEMCAPDNSPRPHCVRFFEELALQGITFTVYSDGLGTERLFPFDLLPPVLWRDEWDRLERGLSQRMFALNLFVDVGVRPALDDDGREHLEETAAMPDEVNPVEAAPLQEQQQQQQQQQQQ